MRKNVQVVLHDPMVHGILKVQCVCRADTLHVCASSASNGFAAI
jgi:hypothetical protein